MGWALSLMYLGFCLRMIRPTSAELVLGLVLGESTLDVVKSWCRRESVGW